MDETPRPFITPACVTLDDLVRYFTNAMDNQESAKVEGHLIECEHCRVFSDRVADIAQEIYERDLVRAGSFSLAFLTEIAGLHVERVKRWIHEGAELAVRVLLPQDGGPATFVVSGIDAMLSPSATFSPAEATVGAFLGDIGSAQSNALEGPVLEIPGVGERRARVVIDAGVTTRVSVQIDNVPRELAAPLAALSPVGIGDTQLKEMTKIEAISGEPDVVDLIADFEVTDAPDVLVVVEPFER